MKRLIKFIRCFALFYIGVFFFFGCSSLKSKNEVRLIEKAILSNEFAENFEICNKKDIIIVFNDSKNNLDFTFLKSNSCFKQVNFSKINFKYDVNSINKKYKGIVFIGIEKNKDWNQLHFFDLETNLSLKLKYNLTEKLIDVKVGNF
jgi:hypothetical protein